MNATNEGTTALERQVNELRGQVAELRKFWRGIVLSAIAILTIFALTLVFAFFLAATGQTAPGKWQWVVFCLGALISTTWAFVAVLALLTNHHRD